MRSELVDFARSTGEFAGSLIKNTVYLVMPGRPGRPASQWIAPFAQLRLLELLDSLRYRPGGPAEGDGKGFDELVRVVTELLGDLVVEPPAEVTQYDLVFRAAELCGLPFEATLDGTGEPLFVRSSPRAIITRRIRAEGFRESIRAWPTVPRVLYAWAAPDAEVPERQHRSALAAALRPWVEPLQIEGFDEAVPNPDPKGILTVLPNATLQSIKDACREAARERPFTHVHLLAHGRTIGSGLQTGFGIALNKSDAGDAAAVARGADLADALCPPGAEPTVVTLAACDSGNIANPVVGSSVAQELHTSGVPVVVGSQMPLTVPGSVTFVERFYRSIFRGEDVRCALHDTRAALWEQRDTGSHDWVSLVGYVQLPEGYADMLPELRLEAEFASLKTVRRWYDFVMERRITDPRAFEAVAAQLTERIANLTRFLEDPETQLSTKALSENRGLLGSAEKRRAELLWRWNGDDRGIHRQQARDALRAACRWYREAFFGDPASHWNAVQYLALQAVLDGKINPGEWHAAKFAASIDQATAQSFWRHGSLAELYLLSTHAGQPKMLNLAREELRQLRRSICHAADQFPLESTKMQLMRYVQWWTTANGFFPGENDLAAQAISLAAAAN